MDDGVTPSSYHAGQVEEKRTIGDFITQLCAYYMAIGMTREEFLDGDRDITDDYELAYECKQIHQNQMMHLQGLYIYQAFGAVLSSAFAPKGKKGEKYMEYPIPITDTEREAEKQRRIQYTLNVVHNRKRSDSNG